MPPDAGRQHTTSPRHPAHPVNPGATAPARGVVGSPPIIAVRRLAPADSMAELTTLLHRAYAKQVEMGLRPLAGRQDETTTRQRVANGECYVAVHTVPRAQGRQQQRLVGAILFHEVEEAKGPPWFQRPDVASFSQFAVDPEYQGMGIGQMLLSVVEERARETGAAHLALSMAEPDQDLMKFYVKRGYAFVEHWQWPYTNYRSAILSKPLD